MTELFDFSREAVDKRGNFTERARFALTRIQQEVRLFGEGSPEGVVTAPQYTEYVDTTAVAAPIKYIKQQTDIAGDRSQGWVAL